MQLTDVCHHAIGLLGPYAPNQSLDLEITIAIPTLWELVLIRFELRLELVNFRLILI